MNLQKLALPGATDVVEKGWSYGQLPVSGNGEWTEFAGFWDDLPRDRYVKQSHKSSRYRRLGRLLARSAKGGGVTVEQLPHATFQQGVDINSVYGGQVRTFAPVEPRFYDNSCCRETLARDLSLIRKLAGADQTWIITIHMIRVPASGDATSAPAPEGRHSDGHDYVIMHLIDRHDCAGGDSRVYHKGSDQPVLEHTLERPMETIVLDDRAMEHEVSPIRPDGAALATRDMMIIDFDRAEPEERFPSGLATVDLETGLDLAIAR